MRLIDSDSLAAEIAREKTGRMALWNWDNAIDKSLALIAPAPAVEAGPTLEQIEQVLSEWWLDADREEKTLARRLHALIAGSKSLSPAVTRAVRYGAASVTRIASDKNKHWVILGVETSKQAIQIYVTKTGKIRISDPNGEWFRLDKHRAASAAPTVGES